MSFISFLKAVGHDFKRGLDFLLFNPYVQAAEGVAFNVLLPGLGPIFNSTKAAVVLAEQKAAALGKQDGTGVQKLADVLQIMEPVIAQALKDAGKDSSTESVKAYINSVVQVLNMAPAPPTAPAP